jgi:hypothetical protein
MFRADLNNLRSIDGPKEVTLVYAESTFRAATSSKGGGYTYRRPVAVRHEPTGIVVPIRDHVMVLRVGLVIAILVATIARWIHGS